MLQKLRNLVRRDDGASMVEYTVLLGLVLAVTIGVISTVGDNLSGVWDAVSENTTDLPAGTEEDET